MQDVSASAELWLPIPDYEDLYEVSNLGRVRSLNRLSYASNGHVRHYRGRTLKMTVKPTGYVYVHLLRGFCTVHRLVALAFLGRPSPSSRLEVCHNDGNPTNNRVENLRWDTRSANSFDKRLHGTAGNSFESAKTHCVNGHEFTPENTKVGYKRGATYRRCAKCNAEAARKARQRQKIE